MTKHVKIIIEVQHVLAAGVAAFMPREARTARNTAVSMAPSLPDATRTTAPASLTSITDGADAAVRKRSTAAPAPTTRCVVRGQVVRGVMTGSGAVGPGVCAAKRIKRAAPAPCRRRADRRNA